MDWSTACAVVIPCFNEEATIARLVGEVRPRLPVVIVVDDGSVDQTAACASKAGAQVVRQQSNAGKGAALKAGIAAAQAQGYKWVVTMDGDGQHRPEDIPTFLVCADGTGATLVVGNRMHQARAIPWLRRAVNRWTSRRISRCVGRCLPDSQCGFRLISLPAWATLRLGADHFEIESDVLLAFVRGGYRVEFVPIQVVGKGPHSHINPVKDTWRWLRWWRHQARG